MNVPPTADSRSVPRPARFRWVGWLLLVLALLAVGWGWRAVGHDLKTKSIAYEASKFSKDQWRQVYEAARMSFARHAEELKKKGYLTLPEKEVPAALKDMGYDEFFATPEGVTYQRSISGLEIYFTAIHCVFDPQSRAYDHKGIWFLGPQMREWVYEEKPSP